MESKVEPLMAGQTMNRISCVHKVVIFLVDLTIKSNASCDLHGQLVSRDSLDVYISSLPILGFQHQCEIIKATPAVPVVQSILCRC